MHHQNLHLVFYLIDLKRIQDGMSLIIYCGDLGFV